MNIRKGDYGYIRREKKKRLLVTLGLFVLPAIVFIVGLVLADGNKSNIFTVVAVVGCLPGCRAAVGFIMMVMHYVSEQDHPCQRLQMPCEDF